MDERRPPGPGAEGDRRRLGRGPVSFSAGPLPSPTAGRWVAGRGLRIGAHRGDCEVAPENTMAAFAAAAVGVHYVEFNVQRATLWAAALSTVPVVVIASDVPLAFRRGGLVRSAAAHLEVARFPALGHTLPGVVIDQVRVNLSLGVLMITSGLQRIPTALIDAACDVGPGRLRTFCG